MATNTERQQAWRERRKQEHAENIDLRDEVARLRAEVHRLEAALAATSPAKEEPKPAEPTNEPKRPTLAEKMKRFHELQEQRAQQAKQEQK